MRTTRLCVVLHRIRPPLPVRPIIQSHARSLSRPDSLDDDPFRLQRNDAPLTMEAANGLAPQNPQRARERATDQEARPGSHAHPETLHKARRLHRLPKAMNGRVPEPSPSARLYRLAREKLLDFSRSLEVSTPLPAERPSPLINPNTLIPPTECEASVQDRGSTQTPRGRKRRSELTSGMEPFSPKRSRLAGPEPQQPPLRDEPADPDSRVRAQASPELETERTHQSVV
jgi:hypothetical protein